MGVRTVQGLVAGSKFANRFLKLVLLLPLDWMLGRWPMMQVVMYVDDVKLKLTGTISEVANITPQATKMLVWWLEHVLKLEVSKDVAGKAGKAASWGQTKKW